MTNKEIKLELAKLTIGTGLSIENAKRFYDWIMEEPEQSEQKPAKWSEDDEAIVKDIIDKLWRLSMTLLGDEAIICKDEIRWLESLRLQTKQELTQDDKQ